MKKSLFSILAVLALAATASAQGGMSEAVALKRGAADAPKFILTDGYIQEDGNRKPHHLTHGPAPEMKLELGGRFNLWFTLQLAEGATSPCTARDEKPCFWDYRLAPPGVSKEQVTDWGENDFRVTEGPLDISIGYPISREALVGHRVLYLRVRYGDTVQYLFEQPIEIRE